MLTGLWFITFGVLLAAWALYYLEASSGRGAALRYRHQYERLIASLEHLVSLANSLGSKLVAVNDPRLIENYESHLKMLITVMEGIRTVPSYSVRTSILKAPRFLVDDMTDRFVKLSSDMKKGIKGTLTELSSSEAALVGCYFCSRPFEAESFKKVRVKLDGKSQDVAACKVCNAKLLAGKKAKVLFFAEGDQTVHWSKSKDFIPSAKYWGINDDSQSEPAPISSIGHLTLVHSNVTPLDSKH